ncbi:hypothetical protein SIN8267_02644 [Sinobacterium norvegicum]|uniref:SH3b domain-containing protein n=1 Tax=Sinobacterium norvegicum TaxID=1641715 RepID=A0ABM9AH25_9GAMM|nr:SH3 domain-containing protein [Sinobacterium norvegicum]CAH0992512.1 hypothetical protein SIN8267_02644 [Sinobacterium norvegicum]
MKKKILWLLATAMPALSLAAEEVQPEPVSTVDEQQHEVSYHVLMLEVIDPYADVHSGPAMGYPVLNVIEQGETVEVLTRRPDWYEVRDQRGRRGWISAKQLSRTLQSTGEPVDLPSVGYGDYLKNSWQLGFSAGQFSGGELKGADLFTVAAGYRLFSWLSAEAEWGQLYSADIKGSMYGANILLEPMSHWRLSPVLVLGGGNMDLQEQPKLTPLLADQSTFFNVGLGANYYMGRNFVIRGEYRWYSMSEDKALDIESWKIGFNAFF